MEKYIVNSYLKDGTIQVDTKIGDHKLISDERMAEGGQNAGPDPVEYLATAVNSCIAISAGALAKANTQTITDFHVENHVELKPIVHTKRNVVSKMIIKVSFEGNIPQSENEEFLRHALHVSTVYNTLAKVVEMDVKLG